MVSRDADSFLMIMHADTYNAVLRQHHYRQKQLSSATALLSELPLFKHLNYSKIASIAYTMKSQTYSAGSVIIRAGQVINNVMLIVSGQIKVFANASDAAAADTSSSKHKAVASSTVSKSLAASYEISVNKMIAKRIPRLAVSILGRGQIIGETEVYHGHRTFEMTYESFAAGTEVLEIPATVFKENITSLDFKKSANFHAIEAMNQEKEERRQGRMHRAYTAMRKMMEGPSKEEKVKEQLLTVLPQVLDPTVSEPGYLGAPNLSSYSARNSTKQSLGSSLASTGKSPRLLSVLNSTGEDAPKVHRRLPSGASPSKSEVFAPTNSLSSHNPASSMAPPSTEKRSVVMQSPRKIHFTSPATSTYV